MRVGAVELMRLTIKAVADRAETGYYAAERGQMYPRYLQNACRACSGPEEAKKNHKID